MMIPREAFVDSLAPLRAKLAEGNEVVQAAMRNARNQNPWFTEAFVEEALASIATAFLDPDKCSAWLSNYPPRTSAPKRIALVMAGNIPLVGFHDLFCVLASGHHAVVKLSEKDAVLLPMVLELWKPFLPGLADAVSIVPRIESIDAVIATGSNNSLRYFEYYFRQYPHVFRQNRNGVAVLTGEESDSELKALGDDIFMYFGLGCRNVSKILVPDGYDFSLWEHAMASWSHLAHHNKYKNNLDYNFAIYIINQVPHTQLGHLILKEDEQIASRIGCVHYHYYHAPGEAALFLEEHRHEIQCVISKDAIDGWEHILPGGSQRPALHQYADGIDTMAFLTSL